MMFLKQQQSAQKQRGVATLMISLILLFSITMMTLYAAQNTVIETQIAANDYRSKLAYEAAQAGLEAAITELQTVANRTLLADGNEVSDADGFIDSNKLIQPSVVLSNNASYHISYSNPIQHDTQLIVITATGQSDDNSSTKTISQTIQLLPLAMNVPSEGLITGGNVTLPKLRQANNSEAISTTKTTLETSLPASEPDCKNSRITLSAQNRSTSPESLFNSTFKMSKTELKEMATKIACSHCSAGYFIDTAGGIAWFEGDIRIAGNGVLGTAGKPILMVVDGDLTMAGNAVYNGLIYTSGNFHTDGGAATINGAMVVEGDFLANEVLCIHYKPAILNNVGKAVGPVARVAGGWRDF